MTASATTTAYRALVLDDRVHASLYVDERVYADEMDRIFTRGWVFVGHKSEVPGPDQRPSFTRELAWLRATRDRVSGYCDALVAARGAALAERSLWDGPPYAMIFPNLFLGEMNIAIVEPLAAAETVHRHTAVRLEGVDEAFNQRLLRSPKPRWDRPASSCPMTPSPRSACRPASPGPAKARRRTAAAGSTSPRSLAREQRMDDGRLVGQISDETTNRAFWRHYRDVMSVAP